MITPPILPPAKDPWGVRLVAVLTSFMRDLVYAVRAITEGRIYGRRTSSAIPTTGGNDAGDVILKDAPTVGSLYGWLCTTAGEPGAVNTELRGCLTGSAALNFATITAQSTAVLTLTVSDAVAGASVILGIPAAAVINGVVYDAAVTNTHQVTVRAHNITAAGIDPASGTFRATVFNP